MKRSLTIPQIRLATLPFWLWLSHALGWLLAGALLIALLYQVPARHTVQVGLNDAAYAQGFSDPVNRWGVIDSNTQITTPFRWTRAQSFLIFPQIGLPATATIRWRALPTPDAPLPRVRVLLNGRDELGTFQTTGTWETHSFAINGGLLKPNDLFLELQTEPVFEVGGELRGVQVDQATLTTSGWPILPYPAQIVYGALAVALGTMLVSRRSSKLAITAAIGMAFVLLYRLQLTPYPLRTLPPLLVAGLAATAGVRLVPWLDGRVRRRLAVVLGVAVVLLWSGWLLRTAQQHVVLSVPGVEKDFRVFATRATSLFCGGTEPRMTASCVLRADGFYQLGYPLLLWLVQPLTNLNPFLAAQLVAVWSAVVLLAATWALGWRLLGHGSALLALLALALSPLVVEYGLYVGTDMPFAALWTAGLAALLVPRRGSAWSVLGAGVVCGLAFAIRHPGIVLLPVGWLMLVVREQEAQIEPARRRLWGLHIRPSILVWFSLGWLLAALPQIVVNVADTGVPLYSQQAKNIWLAVYGNTDWGRWREAADDVRLADVVLADPGRFFGNWGRNLQAFIGTGAEDTREFGQAIELRLLAFPLNWLALIGLAFWVWRGTAMQRLLALGAAVYVAAVSVGFVLPRFFLPLAPIWALASATPLALLAGVGGRGTSLSRPRADDRLKPRRTSLHLTQAQWLLIFGVVLLALMSRAPRIGAQYVLEHQDANAVAVARTLLPRLQPADRVRFVLPPDDSLGKYSALAHYAARSDQSSIQYFVWSSAGGARPSALEGRAALATFGPYTIFDLR